MLGGQAGKKNTHTDKQSINCKEGAKYAANKYFPPTLKNVWRNIPFLPRPITCLYYSLWQAILLEKKIHLFYSLAIVS